MARKRASDRRRSGRRLLASLLIVGLVIVGALGGLAALYSRRQASDSTPGISASDIVRISPGDAKELLDADNAVLYDTRSASVYQLEHAAGAISFPEEDLNSLYRSLPDDKILIFYCT